MCLNESRCQKSTVTNLFVLSLKSSSVLLQLVADSKDMTIFGSNNIVLERQSFQTIPGLSRFR